MNLTQIWRNAAWLIQAALMVIFLFVGGWLLSACQPATTLATATVAVFYSPTATATFAATRTSTTTATPSPTRTATATTTPMPTATLIPTPTLTATATPTPTPTPTSALAHRYRMTYEVEHPTVLGKQTLVDKLWLPLPNTDGNGTTDFKLLSVYPQNYEILDIGEKNQAVYWDGVPDLCPRDNCRFGYQFEITLDRPMYTIPWQDGPIYDPADSLYQTYTRPERGIESDDARIIALARQIVGQETNAYKQVLLIQAWVQQNVRYPVLGSTYPDDAVLCINQGQGDCAGQSKAFVALARAAGLPARTVSGLLPFKRGVGMLELFGPRIAWFDQNMSVHVWIEVYLPPLGWVQGEPNMPGFGIDKERLITKRGPFAFPDGLCQQATYFHLPLAVQGNWCGQSVGWEVSIDTELIEK